MISDLLLHLINVEIISVIITYLTLFQIICCSLSTNYLYKYIGLLTEKKLEEGKSPCCSCSVGHCSSKWVQFVPKYLILAVERWRDPISTIHPHTSLWYSLILCLSRHSKLFIVLSRHNTVSHSLMLLTLLHYTTLHSLTMYQRVNWKKCWHMPSKDHQIFNIFLLKAWHSKVIEVKLTKKLEKKRMINKVCYCYNERSEIRSPVLSMNHRELDWHLFQSLVCWHWIW